MTDFDSESQAFNYSGKSVSHPRKIAIQTSSEKSHCLQIDSERRERLSLLLNNIYLNCATSKTIFFVYI